MGPIRVEVERVVQIRSIHHENVVEVVQVRSFQLAPAQPADVSPPSLCGFHHSLVWRVADVPASRTSRVHFDLGGQASTLHLSLEHSLCEWAPADVTQTDEEDTNWAVGHDQLEMMLEEDTRN